MKSWRRESIETGWHILAVAMVYPPVYKKICRIPHFEQMAIAFTFAGLVYHIRGIGRVRKTDIK